MHDVRMPLIQLTGLRRMAITLLGDRKRHDACHRQSHARNQSPGIFAGHFRRQHRADDAVIGAGAGTNGNGIKTTLRGERIAGIRTAQACADDAPVQSPVCKQVVDHDRLVRPVERPDSEVDDARGDPGTVVIRATDWSGEAAQVGVGKAQMALNRVEIRDFPPSALT